MTDPRLLRQDRAREFLERFLTPEQRQDLESRQFFFVRGSDGKNYRIHLGLVANVELCSSRVRYCAVSDTPVPVYDQMLAQMLLLQTDAQEFFRRALATNLRWILGEMEAHEAS